MPEPLRLAFLGCGFITRVHSRNLRRLGRQHIVASYASRDREKAEAYRRRYGGAASYGSYDEVLADRGVDAVLIAVPPKYHLDLTLGALAAGKHVIVEKPAFPSTADYAAAVAARDRAGCVVLVGENDHYKPLAVQLRRVLATGLIGDMLFAHFVTVARRFKGADDWRNDETMAGGDAFFEEGIHWLHFAANLGPRIVRIEGLRPNAAAIVGDRRAKSMLVAFQYDNSAVGALYYSREIPSMLQGMRQSKIFGRKGIITFESNGLFILARGQFFPRFIWPGISDFRGYRAMYRDFLRAIRTRQQPEMSLERAMEDQRLMDRIYASL